MTRPMTLPRPVPMRDGSNRYAAWAYRDTIRTARTWGDALRTAVANVTRLLGDEVHVVASPSHVTPTGRLSVKVFVRRHDPAACDCWANPEEN